MSKLEFDPEKYYKEVVLCNKDYEKVLNMYLEDIGINTKISLGNYKTLEEVKSHIDELYKSRLHKMWGNYYNFCVDQLAN